MQGHLVHTSVFVSGLRFFICALCLCFFSLPTRAITVRVGAFNDPACGAFSIQGAVAQLPPGTGAHRILLSTNQTYLTAGTIENRSISIEGGYADCSAAAPIPGLLTPIGPLPSATSPLLILRETTSVGLIPIRLHQLDFRGPAPFGAIEINGDLDVTIENSVLRDAGDTAVTGPGGVLVHSGGVVRLRGNTQIVGNRAVIGAGVHCFNFSSILIESSDVLIAGNTAQELGGGILASDCTVVWTPDSQSTLGGVNGNRALVGGGIALQRSQLFGSASINPFGPRRVIANTADFVGGGIYLEDKSSLSVFNLDVSSNTAGVATTPASQGNCGGISAFRSSISLNTFRIEGNVARGNGGGICLFDSARFSVNPTMPCTDGLCRSIAFNRAGLANSAGSGGAFWLQNDNELDVFSTRINNNSAPFHAAIFAEDNGVLPRNRIHLVNSLLVRNSTTGNHGLIGLSGARLELDWTTIANNNVGSSIVFDLGGNSLDLSTSIFSGPLNNTVLNSPSGPQLTTRCIMAHEGASIATQGGGVEVDQPGFADPNNDDYRLRTNSNAADYCNAVANEEPSIDISGNPRLVDLPLTDVLGPWDLGAFEVPCSSCGSDAIFSSGFENPMIP